MEQPLKRVIDLFSEGTECYLGDGPDSSPVVVWVNKPNSFEREEAVRDGTVRRAERMAELGRDSAEAKAMLVELEDWTDDEIIAQIVRQEDDKLHLEALNDLATDPKFRELEEYVRRAPALQGDEEISPDDTRFKTLEAKAVEYNERIDAARKKATFERTADLGEEPHDKLVRMFMDEWRSRRAFPEFMDGKRTTELYLCVRQCKGTRQATLAGELLWDHTDCDAGGLHAKRLFSERAAVRNTPDAAIERIVEVYETQLTSPRDAGNSDAPESSSVSSEPSRAPEAASTPSSPAEPPLDAPGT